MFSMFLNSKDRNYETFIITDGLTNETIQKLDHIGKIFARKIVIKKIESDKIVGKFPVSRHISIAAYFRLFAPELIECDNILWIDSDTIVHCDIAEIFAYNNGSDTVYGVNDGIVQKPCNIRLNMPESEKYINSGVLLIDRNKWINFDVLSKCADFARYKEKIRYWDQCILNKVLQGKKGSIPDRFNTMQHAFDYGKYKGTDISIDSFRGIIHYTTENKPWHAWCNRGLIEFYKLYTRVSPYKMKTVYVPDDEFGKERLQYWLSREGW